MFRTIQTSRQCILILKSTKKKKSLQISIPNKNILQKEGKNKYFFQHLKTEEIYCQKACTRMHVQKSFSGRKKKI